MWQADTIPQVLGSFSLSLPHHFTLTEAAKHLRTTPLVTGTTPLVTGTTPLVTGTTPTCHWYNPTCHW